VDGTLLESLQFVGKWLAKRDPQRSMVTTYEELINAPLDVLSRMNELYELGLTDQQISQIYDYAQPVTNRETGQDHSGYDKTVYPLGWTGRIGIYKQYFSQENLQAFDRVFQAFCQASPWGDHIRQVYPDLT